MREKIDNCTSFTRPRGQVIFMFIRTLRNILFDGKMKKSQINAENFVKLTQFEFYDSRNISLNYCNVNARRLRKTLT